MRELIINADDFGQSVGINRGVIAAHEWGIVTSASLMVRWPAAADAVARAQGWPTLGLGLHVDLGEWAFRNGEWRTLYTVVALDDATAVSKEIRRQLNDFRRLTSSEPTHLDSHQHVHRTGVARATLEALARELGVPLRHDTPTVRHCGAFYGQMGDGRALPQGITADALVALLGDLPEGVTELSCHPALGTGSELDSMYVAERELELRTLCDLRVRNAIDALGIRLRSFAASPLPSASQPVAHL